MTQSYAIKFSSFFPFCSKNAVKRSEMSNGIKECVYFESKFALAFENSYGLGNHLKLVGNICLYQNGHLNSNDWYITLLVIWHV